MKKRTQHFVVFHIFLPLFDAVCCSPWSKWMASTNSRSRSDLCVGMGAGLWTLAFCGSFLEFPAHGARLPTSPTTWLAIALENPVCKPVQMYYQVGLRGVAGVFWRKNVLNHGLEPMHDVFFRYSYSQALDRLHRAKGKSRQESLDLVQKKVSRCLVKVFKFSFSLSLSLSLYIYRYALFVQRNHVFESLQAF